MPEVSSPVSPSSSDPELISATRAGDTTAYAALYERHVPAARRLARALTSDAALADDLVSETFAKLLTVLRDGQGPDLGFRPYLLRSLRNTFYDRVRRDKKIEYTDDLTAHEVGQTQPDPAVAGQDRRYAVLAYSKLPERWQMVLWHTEVEEDSPASIAPLLGMTANGVAALAYRARERLRQLYLQEHIADAPSQECGWTVDRLGARVRGTLAARDGTKVDGHLDSCAACKVLYMELAEVNSGLRGVLAPVVLGAAAPAYLAGTSTTAAGAAFAGFFAVVLEPFRVAASWIRRIVERLGTRGSVATGGAVAAVAAGLVALAMVANTTTVPPEESAAPPAEEEETDSPADEPDDDEPEDDEPEDEPEDDPPPPADEPDEEPAEEEDEPTEPDDEPTDDPPSDDPPDEDDPPSEYDVAYDLGNPNLIAGGDNTLPLELQAADTDEGGTGAGAGRIAVDPLPEAAATSSDRPSGFIGPWVDVTDLLNDNRPNGFIGPWIDAADLDDSDTSATREESGSASDSEPENQLTNNEPGPTDDDADTSRIRLTMDLPDGFHLTGSDASDGWECDSSSNQISCEREPLEAGQDTTALVPINIDSGISGYQTLTISLSGAGESQADLRVPVAPPGSAVGYASLEATDVATAGNTWLDCAPFACQEQALVGWKDNFPMEPYYPAPHHPQPPDGKHTHAASGANLNIPDGSQVEWAGLYWAASADSVPGSVALAGPNGNWVDVGSSETKHAGPMTQAHADVTQLVQSGGEYWLAADPDLLPGCDQVSSKLESLEWDEWNQEKWDKCAGATAGWGLTVVYSDPNSPEREIAVYDSPQHLNNNDFNIEVQGGSELGVGYLLWGGSGILRHDSMTVGGQPVGRPDNVARSRSSSAVNHFDWWYTFGVDADHQLVVTESGPQDLVVNSGGDSFTVGVIALATPPTE